MTTIYKVWLEIEEIDESCDHYETAGTPGGAIATFDTYQAARSFVDLFSGDSSQLAIVRELVGACHLAVQCLNDIPNTRTRVGKSYDVVRRIEAAIQNADGRPI